MSLSRGKTATTVVRRNGEVQGWATRAVEHQSSGAEEDANSPKLTLEEGEREWERTSNGNGQLPNPDIVFKCVDAGTAVVLGVDERHRNLSVLSDTASSTSEESGSLVVNRVDCEVEASEALPIPSSSQEAKRKDLQSQSPTDADSGARRKADAPGYSNNANGEPLVAGNIEGGDTEYHRKVFSGSAGQTNTPVVVDGSPQSALIHDTTRRPQVCAPLIGSGDSGCIGIIGVQGFTTGITVGDDDWQDWFAARIGPLYRGEHRAVKRLKLVRPRGLPTRGKLENMPSGTAAKVVCGSVERVSHKRGVPVYTVR